MAYEVIVSTDTDQDIDKIIHYVAVDLANSTAAKLFLNAVLKSYVKLAKNPYIYALCNDQQLQQKGYRKVVIKHYLLLFRIDEPTQTVYVTRAVYSGSNYAKLV
jgi:plasmid stabilization system protein ParE